MYCDVLARLVRPPRNLLTFYLTGTLAAAAALAWLGWRLLDQQRIAGPIAARQLTGVRLHPNGRHVAIGDIKVDLEVWVMENFLPKSSTAPGAKAKQKAASGPLKQPKLPIPSETELEEVNCLGAVRVRYLRRW